MADEILGTAQIEIVASLDSLRAGLAQAQDEVAGSMETIGASVSKAGRVFDLALSDAAREMLDAVVAAGRTGDSWRSLGNAAVGLATDIEKVILQLMILDPLLNEMLGRGAGGPLPALGAPSIADFLGSIGASLAGSFASGGEFEVGGGGGADSALVAFRATPGERVRVLPRSSGTGEDQGGGAATVNVKVHNYSGAEARVSETRNSQGGRDIAVIIGDAMARDVRTNGPLGQAMRQTYAAQVNPIQR